MTQNALTAVNPATILNAALQGAESIAATLDNIRRLAAGDQARGNVGFNESERHEHAVRLANIFNVRVDEWLGWIGAAYDLLPQSTDLVQAGGFVESNHHRAVAEMGHSFSREIDIAPDDSRPLFDRWPQLCASIAAWPGFYTTADVRAQPGFFVLPCPFNYDALIKRLRAESWQANREIPLASVGAPSGGGVKYLNATLDREERVIATNSGTASFDRSGQQWNLVRTLYEAGAEGRSRREVMDAVFEEPKTDNALDQVKSKVNGLLMGIKLEVVAESGIWCLVAI